MHIISYVCVECGEEYEVSQEQESFSPGRFFFCDECCKMQLFTLVEHVEIQKVAS